jgi:hypothetical protein
MAGAQRRSLTTAPDVWAEAVHLLEIVAEADGLNAANAALRRAIRGFDKEAVRDLVVALAVIPRFGMHSPMMSSPRSLAELRFWMSWAWGDDEPAEGGSP